MGRLQTRKQFKEKPETFAKLLRGPSEGDNVFGDVTSRLQDGVER